MTNKVTSGPSWPDIKDGEILLENADEKLWRQVRPNMFDQGQIGEGAFIPTSSDPRRLSCSREALQSAEGAYDDYVRRGYKSAGTCAVTVEEVASVKSRAIDDSSVQEGEDPTPGHTYIDYRGLDRTGRQEAREELAFYATNRGLLHP